MAETGFEPRFHLTPKSGLFAERLLDCKHLGGKQYLRITAWGFDACIDWDLTKRPGAGASEKMPEGCPKWLSILCPEGSKSNTT